MRKAYLLSAITFISLLCPAQFAKAQSGGSLKISIQGNCDDSKLGEGILGNLLERLTVRPLLAPRDGTRQRRAAVQTVRKNVQATTLDINSNLSFAGNIPILPRDIIHSIAVCAPETRDVAQVISPTSVSFGIGIDVDLFRGCNLRQESSDAIFGSRAGKLGAYVASGPYEVLNWNKSRIVLTRMTDEGRGPENIEVRCLSEAAMAIGHVRSGSLEAVFLAAGSIAPEVGARDETVYVSRCSTVGGLNYEVFSRNQSISCLERLDPLAIIAE